VLGFLGLLPLGCATGGAPGRGGTHEPGSARRTSGYEVREAADGEDGDGSRLQLEQDHGFISQEAAQSALARRWADLRNCYHAAGTSAAFAGGRVSLRFVVAASGATSEVQVRETQLGNFDVERCLVDTGRTVAFPAPRGGASTTVDYTLEFRSTGEVAVIDLPDDAVAANLPALLGQQLGTRCPTLGGEEVFATVYVNAGGAVQSAGLAAPTSLDQEAATCLAQALHLATIPLRGLRGGNLGRLTIALRAADLLARTEPARRSRKARRARR
jgi:hypothetical protein